MMWIPSTNLLTFNTHAKPVEPVAKFLLAFENWTYLFQGKIWFVNPRLTNLSNLNDILDKEINVSKRQTQSPLQACGLLLDLVEIFQSKLNAHAAMKLMLLQVSQMKLRYHIKLCKTFGLASFVPYVSNQIW